MKSDAEDRAKNEDKSEEPLEAIADEAMASAENGKVRLREILKGWGDRSYGPLFILLGIFAGTPLAVVPFAAAAVGLLIAGLAIQMAFGKSYPWLPAFTLDWSVDRQRLDQTRDKLSSVLKFFDFLITERLTFATGRTMRRVAAGIVAVLGLLMAPMDAVPFAVAAPAWAIVLFGVAITARDGLAMILAMLACGGVLGLGFGAI